MLTYRSPSGVLTLVSSLATKTHKTLHHIDTDETMVRSRPSSMTRSLSTPRPAYVLTPVPTYLGPDLHEGADGPSAQAQAHHGPAELVSSRLRCAHRRPHFRHPRRAREGRRGDDGVRHGLYLLGRNALSAASDAAAGGSLARADNTFLSRYAMRIPPPAW